MSDPFESLHHVNRATADVGTRLAFIVFVRGRLAPHVAALQALLSRLQDGWLGQNLTHYRAGAATEWSRVTSCADMLKNWPLDTVPHLIEFDNHAASPQQANNWQFVDVAPLPDTERASHIFIRFADDVPVSVLSELAGWFIEMLPLWWAAGGYMFEHRSGPVLTAHVRMAALAKRYWAVQIIDRPSLQWDAMRGMPAVNWLTAIGHEFCDKLGVQADQLTSDAERVFRRSGRHGLVLAAGPRPVLGDINAYEDFDPYLHVARTLAPFLLHSAIALAGPFARPDVLSTWLRRFEQPEQWLSCDIRLDEL
jgi:hypothetical protein